MTLLVVTPIPEEFDHLARYLKKEQGNAVENIVLGRIPARRFPALDLVLASGGLGKAQFALQTQHLVDACPSVNAVVCAGAAGALDPSLRAREIVVATETVEHDAVYRFIRRPVPRFPGSAEMIARLRAVAASAPFKVHFGPVASGDEDVVGRKRAEEIRARTGALAVAWEGAGGARASKFNGLPYLEIRGISDGADPLALVSFIFHLGGLMERIGWLILKLCQEPNEPGTTG